MKNLEVRTTKAKSNNPKYTQNLNDVILFLRHTEDKIHIINGETVNIEIYDNGEPLFIGNKYELFEILKNHNVQ